MKKIEVVQTILGERKHALPRNTHGRAYAPSNIALCKYWGKRNQELNLPVTSSLSISLGDKGATTEIAVSEHDSIAVNGTAVAWSSAFGKRLQAFLELFRVNPELHFDIQVQTNIPIGAGLASSACGFAALVQALNALFGWELTQQELSILARIGSGSASRSLWQGFVEWHAGERTDGMDSHGSVVNAEWPEFCLGLLILSEREKSIGSREAMQRTVATSPLYVNWSEKVKHDLESIKQAIHEKNFELLGQTAEWNAMTMHATMLSAWPSINYALPETIVAMKKISCLRQDGLPVFFTQDAGPNLKLLFLKRDVAAVQEHFANLEIIQPFNAI